MEILKAGAMVLAVIAPTSHDRWEAHAEGRVLHFESAGGLNCLMRCAKWAFPREKLPSWLAAAIVPLEMDSVRLAEINVMRAKQAGLPNTTMEVFSRHLVFEELLVHVQLDHIISESHDRRDQGAIKVRSRRLEQKFSP
mmetsp:Transcript_32063/g.99030  ORF Transcript_32063/g.99030 Transcript_32063/m.99030 type:complete len:139 (+) Transcript_32063:2037-2453(+)